MASRRRVVPLRDRRADLFFVLAFAFFAFSSFFSDAWAGLGVDFSPDSPNFWARANYWYAAGTDPYFLSHPIHLRLQTFISGFVFGPFYLLLVYAFVTGKDWIRMPALLYTAAMVYGMVIFLGSELFGPLPPTNMQKFLAFNMPYLLVPLALAYRVRREYPFSQALVVDATRGRRAGTRLTGTGTGT